MRPNTAKILKTTTVCAVLIFFGGVIIYNPQRYTEVCFEGICMWAECVLPSLFPFMVITLLLVKIGAVDAAARPLSKLSGKLKLPASAIPLFLISLCSGYPAGSRVLVEYRDSNLICDEEVKRLAPLCSPCGPLFALGTVGGKAFGSASAGTMIFFASLISVVSTSLIYNLFCKRPPTRAPKLKKRSDENVLQSTFYGAVTASITAGGFICFFYTLAKVFEDFMIFAPLTTLLSPLLGEGAAAGLCTGFIEATGGCFAAASHGGFFALPVVGFLVTFGGISILLQQICYLQKCGVKTSVFVFFKFIQGALCFAILCLFLLF